ncbi:adenylosuccinate lyase [Candidatus Parcubacteria bacterium]|nr:adenylosuccinate lyase [Candidatus Parcubacteria bacterium]
MQPFDLPEPSQPGYGSIDPLDSRYFDAEVAKYLSEEARITYQAYVEAALAYALAEFGIGSRKAAEEIEQSARKITAETVYTEEKTTRHDIKALINCIKTGISDEAKPYVHFGATSYDIIATANALQMRAVIDNVLIPRAKDLLNTLSKIAEKYAETPQIGRTHGQHAVPITFGFAVAEYVERLGYSIEALRWLKDELRGKFSGATGSYNALSTFVDDPIAFEKAVLDKVGLAPAPYSTQIVPPENLVRIIDEIKTMSGILANLGNDMRNLQRSEIAEIREKFEEGQTGSSTMAHKRNPWNFENVVSLNKQVLAQALNASQNLQSDHQRDLTDSANSRFYVLPVALVCNMLSRTDRIMNKIEVDEEAMQRNLKLTGGAIAAEPFYLLLEKYGHTQAHEKSKALAHEALKSGKSLVEVIEADQEADSYWQKFSDKEKQIISEPEKYYTGQAAQKTKDIISRHN